MNTIPEATVALQFTLDRIRSMHGPIEQDGTVRCQHCKTVWPCETHSVALANHLDGTWNLDNSYRHLEGKLSMLPAVLQKVEEELGRLASPLTEDAITAIHRLCLVDGVRARGLINPVGRAEIQFSAVQGSEVVPLWGLSLALPMELRIFGPERAGVGHNFFRELVSLSFETSETDEVVEWWSTICADHHTYVTTTLGDDDQACSRILTMCSLTERFVE